MKIEYIMSIFNNDYWKQIVSDNIEEVNKKLQTLVLPEDAVFVFECVEGGFIKNAIKQSIKNWPDFYSTYESTKMF